jgi:hypothetical protein
MQSPLEEKLLPANNFYKAEAIKTTTLKYQVLMFTLCYAIWTGIHVERTYWTMVKSEIAEDNPTLPITFYSSIDTSYLITKSVGMFFLG